MTRLIKRTPTGQVETPTSQQREAGVSLIPETDGDGYLSKSFLEDSGNWDSAWARSPKELSLSGETLHLSREDSSDLTVDLSTVLGDYEKTSNKGAAGGYAPLNSDSKIPQTYIPQIALSEPHVVADITERDGLTVEEGDVAIVQDASDDPDVDSGSASYIYDGTDWQRFLSPDAPVDSINGMTGTVTLETDDVDEGSSNLYFTDSRAVSAIKADSDWNATDWDEAYGWGNHADAGYLTSVAVEHSIDGDGDDTPLALVGDEASPGNDKYYGTDGSGNRGFFDLPSGSSVDESADYDWTGLHSYISDGGAAYTQYYSYRDASGTHNAIVARSARGSEASPAALQEGDNIFNIQPKWHDGSGWNGSSSNYLDFKYAGNSEVNAIFRSNLKAIFESVALFDSGSYKDHINLERNGGKRQITMGGSQGILEGGEWRVIGNFVVDDDLDVGGVQTWATDTWHQSSDGKWRIRFHDDSNTDIRAAGSGHIRLKDSNNDVNLFIYGNGNVHAPNGYVRGSGLRADSDMRLKKNWEPIIDPWGVIDGLKDAVGEFDWKKNGNHDSGFNAQKAREVCPHLIGEDEETGFLHMSQISVIPYLVAAVADLKGQMEALSHG